MTIAVQKEVKTYQMFINGEWVDSHSGKTVPVYDPSTEEVIAEVADANAADVNRAVAAAKTAFEESALGCNNRTGAWPRAFPLR